MGTLALHVVSSRGLLLSRLAPLHCSRLQRSSLLRISSRCHSSLVRVVERDDKDDTENEEWLTLKAQHQHAPLTCNNASSLRQASAAVDTSTTSTSPSELVYTGNHRIPVTSHLHIVTPSEDVPRGVWPIFRLMDDDGHFRDPAADGYKYAVSLHKKQPNTTTASPTNDLDKLRLDLCQEYPHFIHELTNSPLLKESLHEYPDTPGSKHTLLRAHLQMLRLREMDTILQNAQRQGRISFYMTCRGEEAIHIGAASALSREDVVLAQYREAGILMWRGFTLQQFTNQCFSNDQDLGKGRQMPVHYGSRALNYQTISSPLGTQLPQAVGAAYHYKLCHENKVAACFFGDGCASTTDFHSACNFAATLQVPVLFLCRNNGYAISTPVTDQYAGDGIVSRAPGYGMAGIRVDGNDVFAVSAAVQAAKQYAVEHSAPVLVEFMTYRQGHHSTSDDSTRYRNAEEVQHHEHNGDPLQRLQAFLTNQGLLDSTSIVSIRDEEKLAVLQAMEQAEQRPDPPLDDLFEDVYEEMPLHLQRQEEELRQHIAKYPKRYS